VNADKVKRFHKWALGLWIMPGLPISLYLRNSVAWVMVLSIYTILVEHALGWRQEKEQA
jgi:hypothetical protein